MNPAEYDALFATEDSHWWFQGLWRDVEEAIEHFAPRRAKGLVWLDAGSGTAGLLARLSGSGRFRLAAGLELSPDGLALARRRRLPALAQGSVSRMPFRDATFDVITSIDVLYHRNVAASDALEEAARCLATDGIFVLQVPAYQWLRSSHDRAVWTNRRFSRPEVKALVEAAGLSTRSCVYRNSLLFPLAAGKRLLSRGHEGDRSDVSPASPLVNAIGTTALSVESALGRARIRAPFGLSVFCVASR